MVGYDRSYPSFTRALRLRGGTATVRAVPPGQGPGRAVIDHPAGEETQWRFDRMSSVVHPAVKPPDRHCA